MNETDGKAFEGEVLPAYKDIINGLKKEFDGFIAYTLSKPNSLNRRRLLRSHGVTVSLKLAEYIPNIAPPVMDREYPLHPPGLLNLDITNFELPFDIRHDPEIWEKFIQYVQQENPWDATFIQTGDRRGNPPLALWCEENGWIPVFPADHFRKPDPNPFDRLDPKYRHPETYFKLTEAGELKFSQALLDIIDPKGES